MTALQDRVPKATRPLPADLADLSFLDINDVCAAVRMSQSWWYDEVRAGRAPQPLRLGLRCSRWSVAAIRQYLIERAAQPQEAVAAQVVARATRASADARKPAAKAKAAATRAAKKNAALSRPQSINCEPA